MRYLMISENRGSMCRYCPSNCDSNSPCHHGYSYWSDDCDENIATNLDNAHFTGLSEERARKIAEYDPVINHWVRHADRW